MDRFKLLESFVAVAKSGSYSQAARQLGVSRALMSKRIMALEARLGARLLNRNTHQLSLTDAGTTYLTSCQSALAELESAEASLIERRKVPRGSLRVLAPHTFGRTQVWPAAIRFMRRYPEIDLYIGIRDLGRQTVDLVAGGFDLALRTRELADSSLVMRKIVPLDWFVVAAPAYLAAHGRPSAPEDLLQHRCLIVNAQPGQRWELEGGGRPGLVKIPAISVSNAAVVTRDATLACLGLALLPDYYIAADLEAGRLERVLPEYRGKRRWLMAIYPRDRNPPLKTRLFIDFLVERFRDGDWAGLSRESDDEPAPLFRRQAGVG